MQRLFPARTNEEWCDADEVDGVIAAFSLHLEKTHEAKM